MKETQCKKCNSSQTYIRFNTNERICRKCGFIEKLKGGDLKCLDARKKKLNQ